MLEIESFTGGIASTNGYACKSNELGIVVDAPEGMADWLQSIDFQPVALLLTHAHFDHVMDAAEIQKRWSIPIYAFVEPTPELTLGGLFGLDVPAYKVDHFVEEGVSTVINDLTFEILHVPGHSVDSVVYLLESDEIAFGGDVLMQGSVGRSDFPGGDQTLLLEGIREKLYVLGDGVAIHPGHGPATSVGVEKQTNPFVQG